MRATLVVILVIAVCAIGLGCQKRPSKSSAMEEALRIERDSLANLEQDLLSATPEESQKVSESVRVVRAKVAYLATNPDLEKPWLYLVEVLPPSPDMSVQLLGIKWLEYKTRGVGFEVVGSREGGRLRVPVVLEQLVGNSPYLIRDPLIMIGISYEEVSEPKVRESDIGSDAGWQPKVLVVPKEWKTQGFSVSVFDDKGNASATVSANWFKGEGSVGPRE